MIDVLVLAQTTVMSPRQAQVYVWVLEAIQKLGNYEDAQMEDMSRAILGMAAVTGDSPVTSAFEMHDFIKGAIESGWWEKRQDRAEEGERNREPSATVGQTRKPRIEHGRRRQGIQSHAVWWRKP